MQDMQALFNYLLIREFYVYVSKKSLARHASKIETCMSCNKIYMNIYSITRCDSDC